MVTTNGGPEADVAAGQQPQLNVLVQYVEL